MATVKPFFANSTAIPLPKPLPEPVTKTIGESSFSLLILVNNYIIILPDMPSLDFSLQKTLFQPIKT
jgi:hypothetical protein